MGLLVGHGVRKKAGNTLGALFVFKNGTVHHFKGLQTTATEKPIINNKQKFMGEFIKSSKLE